MLVDRYIALHFLPETPWLKEVFPGIAAYVEEQGNWRLGFLHPEQQIKDFGRVDGVITEGSYIGPDLKHIPVMSLNSRAKRCVTTDNTLAGSLACEHLLERGYRQLFFFQSNSTADRNPFLREQGFRNAARGSGVNVTTFASGPRTRKRGEWVLEDNTKDLADALREMPTPFGATAANPDHIQRFHQACKQANLRIPEHAGLICPTDDSVILPYLEPGISSVNHDRYRIGYEAARLLDRLMQGKTIQMKTLIPPKEIIVRASTDHRIVGDPLCEEIVNYIWDHLEEAPTTEWLAQRFHLSERTLYRRFKTHVGRTPSEELRYARIETAKRLLKTTTLPLIDIAMECGYGGQSQFNRDFKAAMKLTPRQFQEDT